MKKIFLYLSVIFLFSSMAGLVSADNLLVNGGFETGTTNWYSFNPSFTKSAQVYNVSDPADYFAILNSDLSDWMVLGQQFFIDKSAKGVNISFDYLSYGGGIFTSNLNLVTSNNPFAVQQYNLVNDTQPGFKHFETYFDLTDKKNIWVESGSAIIDFFLINVANESTIYAVVDKVSVEAVYAPVPEPATMLLLGTGLACFAGLRRKFKKA